jgi:hypothetical protein
MQQFIMLLETAIVLLVCAFVKGQNCPAFSCSALLDSNVCASRSKDGVYQLNANGCYSAYHCSITELFAWIGQSGISATTPDPVKTQGVYSCVADVQVVDVSKDWSSVICQVHRQGRGFKSGQATVTCALDTDCELADGETTACTCSFRPDGYGICQPDLSNDLIFAGYWTDCGSVNTIKSEDVYNYWKKYQEMYVYLQSPLVCVDVFQELQGLYTLWVTYTSAEALVLALVLFV